MQIEEMGVQRIGQLFIISIAGVMLTNTPSFNQPIEDMSHLTRRGIQIHIYEIQLHPLILFSSFFQVVNFKKKLVNILRGQWFKVCDHFHTQFENRCDIYDKCRFWSGCLNMWMLET